MVGDKAYGLDSEKLAVGHLRKKGYKILERNYRTRLGEIDIIARHKDVLVFVEVKARRSLRYGHPKLAVTPAKQRTLSRVALAYLKDNGGLNTRARFDVVTVLNLDDRAQIEIFPNAFELAGMD
ncbi:MAG: YraN family protein [Desulfosarcinaceae bacterium]